jgi:hypothetical protein
MKITKTKLKQIIKEEFHKIILEREYDEEISDDSKESKDFEDKEYDRGYQDGLEGLPIADDATGAYDAGYEDGQNDVV